MTLLQPAYLWGLVALAIPIAIHLWSRKKVRTIKVGSTQFINETKSKQSNSIQINELWLLALRCLIIIALVIILAEPFSSITPQQQDIVYVFEPSLLASEEGLARFKQIPQDRRRLLSSGFPVVGDEVVISDGVPNYWQLALEMESIPADSIVVFTHAFAKAIKGKRPTISAAINWIPVDVGNSIAEPFTARIKKDSVEVVTINSDATRLAFAKAKIAKDNVSFNTRKDSIEVDIERGLQSIPVYHQNPIDITIVYNEATNIERRYLEAAFRAIGNYTDREVQINVTKDLSDSIINKSDYLVLLNVLQIITKEIPTLLYRPDGLERELIAPGSTTTESLLTKKLSALIIEEEHLVRHLLNWLQLDLEINKKLENYDKRTLSSSQLQTGVSAKNAITKKLIVADLSDNLWILLVVLIVGERILARVRKQ